MEFGRVDKKLLNKIDFRLPAEPSFNNEILKGKPYKKAAVYVGCAKWGRPDWVGKLYPPKTKEKDFLKNYVNHYNSIELNATHYKIYGAKGIRKWKDEANKTDFLFCPKMYQGVTHKGDLKRKEFLTKEFLRGVAAFEENLGPIFIQVNESFSPNRRKELFEYLGRLPNDLQFFLEVRHAGWFSSPEIRNELFTTLNKLKIGAVITDTAGRRDCAHMHLTIPKVFIRFVGNNLHKTDHTRMDDWVKRIKYWLKSGLQELYFFMHMHDELDSPELTVELIDKMNKACGLELIKPRLYTGEKVAPPKKRMPKLLRQLEEIQNRSKK